MYRIIVHRAFDRRGNRLHGKFVASLDGRQVCGPASRCWIVPAS